jgi:hypothetical protein
MSSYLSSEGIVHTTTTPDHPSHNGKAERFNQTLIRLTRSMLHGCGAHFTLWGEAITYAVYVYNRTPIKVKSGLTPYECLYGKEPDISKIRTFGSNCYYLLPTANQSKLQATAQKGVWIGFNESSGGSRILTTTDNQSIIHTRETRLEEEKFTTLLEIMGFDPPPSGTLSLSPDQVKPPLMSINDQENESSYFDQPQFQSIEVPADSDPTVHFVGQSDIATSTSSVQSNRLQSRSGSMDSTSSYRFDDMIDGPFDNQPDSEIDETFSSHSDSDSDLNSSTSTVEAVPLNSKRQAIEPPVIAPLTTRSGRVSQPVHRYGMASNRDLYIGDQRTMNESGLAMVESIAEPNTFAQAMKTTNAAEWLQAANVEVASMARQGVYKLVPFDRSMKLIRSRWVFKVKLDANNMPTKFKARLVAKGFEQREGIDYHETYAPVCKYKSIRTVLTLASTYGMSIKQIDYQTAFLNAGLDETIHMHQPEGYAVTGDNGERMVWLLKRAIYGLKQSPRQWNDELDGTLVNLGYQPTINDPCLYTKKIEGYLPIILTLYVDDTLAVYPPELEHVWMKDKAIISSTYPITDLGDCNWILNMSVKQSVDKHTIHLSQRAYVEKMLATFNMTDCKPAETPSTMVDLTDPTVDVGPVLSAAQHELYRSIVGSALYAANTTRIDIAYTVGVLARFVAAPRLGHLTAAKRLLRYLKHTIDHSICFTGKSTDKLQFTCYADANWGGDLTDRKSTSGYVMLLNNNLVSWQSKKQPTVALSSTESEYIALSAATCESRWISDLLHQILDTYLPITIYCDNQSAIARVNSDAYSERTKHIDIRHHFIKSYVKSNQIDLLWVSTEQQLADVLTKTLNKITHTKFTSLLLST